MASNHDRFSKFSPAGFSYVSLVQPAFLFILVLCGIVGLAQTFQPAAASAENPRDTADFKSPAKTATGKGSFKSTIGSGKRRYTVRHSVLDEPYSQWNEEFADAGTARPDLKERNVKDPILTTAKSTRTTGRDAVTDTGLIAPKIVALQSASHEIAEPKKVSRSGKLASLAVMPNRTGIIFISGDSDIPLSTSLEATTDFGGMINIAGGNENAIVLASSKRKYGIKKRRIGTRHVGGRKMYRHSGGNIRYLYGSRNRHLSRGGYDYHKRNSYGGRRYLHTGHGQHYHDRYHRRSTGNIVILNGGNATGSLAPIAGSDDCGYGEYCTIDLGGPKIITRNTLGDIREGELVDPAISK